jgi:hypothetical protein
LRSTHGGIYTLNGWPSQATPLLLSIRKAPAERVRVNPSFTPGHGPKCCVHSRIGAPRSVTLHTCTRIRDSRVVAIGMACAHAVCPMPADVRIRRVVIVCHGAGSGFRLGVGLPQRTPAKTTLARAISREIDTARTQRRFLERSPRRRAVPRLRGDRILPDDTHTPGNDMTNHLRNRQYAA